MAVDSSPQCENTSQEVCTVEAGDRYHVEYRQEKIDLPQGYEYGVIFFWDDVEPDAGDAQGPDEKVGKGAGNRYDCRGEWRQGGVAYITTDDERKRHVAEPHEDGEEIPEVGCVEDGKSAECHRNKFVRKLMEDDGRGSDEGGFFNARKPGCLLVVSNRVNIFPYFRAE